MTRIAINGLGRIGRAAFKHIIEDGTLELAAVNDLVLAEELVYLLKQDSVYGRSEWGHAATAGARGEGRGSRGPIVGRTS